MTTNPVDFQHPEVLGYLPWLAGLACAHLALMLQQWWWQKRQFGPLALKRFGPGLSLWRGLLKLVLWAGASWYLLLALAVPLGPPIKIDGKQFGADVVFCVDVSSSMLAQDIEPNRLGAVKKALSGLLGDIDGDRVGLVAFAGGAVVACPLTTDYDTAELFLDKLDVDSVPRDGTDLASAIQMALDGFGQDTQRGKLVVLATDGEDTLNSDVLEEARRARQAGVIVECVGVGMEEGALIPGQKDMFGRVFAKTWHGQPVRTKLDRPGLEKIAAAAGGDYLPGNSEVSLKRMADRIRALKQGLGKAPDRTVREPLYQVPLLWALVLFLIESLVSSRSRGSLKMLGRFVKKISKRWHTGRVAVGVLGLLLLSASAWADLDNGRSDYNEGNNAYRHGDYDGAVDNYRKAASASTVQEASQYNLGNALFQKQDYQGAIDAYDQALKLNTDDQDAQYNRDLAQQMLDRKNKKPDDKQKKKDDKNKPGKQKGSKQGGQQNSQQGNPQGGRQGGQNSSSSGADQSRQRQGPPGPRLSRDQIETMMNKLRLDQRKYSGAFNPLKHFGRKDQKPEDPAQQLLEQMGGLNPQATPDPNQNDPNYKDW